MDSDYKAKIKDEPLKKLLLQKENIPRLEDILNRDSQEFERLRKLEEGGKLDFGGTIPSNKLGEVVPPVFSDVDNFLGISQEKTPKYGYFSLIKPGFGTAILAAYALHAYKTVELVNDIASGQFYGAEDILGTFLIISGIAQAVLCHNLLSSTSFNSVSKGITLERWPRNKLIPAVGHEYAHFVQGSSGLGLSKLDSTVFKEGHARGVQKYLSGLYQEREDNEAFLYDVLKMSVPEFRDTYKWMCRKLGQKPNESLLKRKDVWDKGGTPSEHAIGNTLFSIYENDLGDGIYSQMVKGEFNFSG
jgi:hypothetical protein